MTTTATHTKKGFIIAIDGPVASGKGTITPIIAKHIKGFYLYSGAVFRCIGLFCIERGVNTAYEASVKAVLNDITIDLTEHTILLNGKDVTNRLKKEDVAMAASNVGVFKDVRHMMVAIMRDVAKRMIAKGIPVVTEGRDMATTVFPDADIKIFLTAKPEIRAKRRLAQIQKSNHTGITFEQVLADTKLRDKQDSEREISPLVTEPEKHGYLIVDDSALTEKQTENYILDALREKKLYNDDHY